MKIPDYSPFTVIRNMFPFLVLVFLFQYVRVCKFTFGHFSFGVEQRKGTVTQQVRLFAVS